MKIFLFFFLSRKCARHVVRKYFVSKRKVMWVFLMGLSANNAHSVEKLFVSLNWDGVGVTFWIR